MRCICPRLFLWPNKSILHPWVWLAWLVLALAAWSCAALPSVADVEPVWASLTPPTAVTSSLAAPTLTAPMPSPLPTQTSPPSPTPYGCTRPPDEYTLIELQGGYVLNRRTIWMLEHAQTLYGGSHNFLQAVTQGSYHTGVAASFGTHDGGGAVDLSLRDLNDWHHILLEDAESIILAMRQAGFAAWVREADVLYPGSPLHIHAVAIGDADLSAAAQSQLIGPEGYFRGMNGLPDNPRPDPHGGPILCPWMIEMGYADLRDDS